MPSTTALAISPERQFLRKMVTGLTAAGGDVTGVESFKEAYKHLADARVVFYHAVNYPDDTIQKLANVLKGGRRLVLLLPRPGIADLIVPLAMDQVSAVLAVAAADSATLAGVASRSFFGNIFGLERYVPYGVRVHTTLIRDYHQKTVAMATLANFAKHMNIRRKYLENIERVVDELLMNALYDAPLVASQLGLVDGSVPQNDQLVLQFASDGELFALGVTDYYGALQKEVFLEYVTRCLTSARPINQPESGSGAGLGLYLVASSVSQLTFNVSPGVATEVVALFNLKAPKIRLTHLSFETERAEATRVPSLAAGRPRPATAAANGARRPGTPLSLKLTLAAAVLVLLAAGGLLLWNRLSPEPERGGLAIRTDPPGATVTVDGASRGRTPEKGGALVVGGLVAGRHTVLARKEGYRTPDPSVATVRPGRRSPLAIRLEPLRATLKVLSSPPGAALSVDGASRGKTPVVVDNLVPRSKVGLRLEYPGYQVEERVVTAPGPGATDAEVFQLRLSPDWGQLTVTANVEVKGVTLDGRPVGSPLPLRGFRVAVGEHRLELGSRWPYLSYQATFKIPKAGHEERIHVDFGRVRPVGEHTRVYWDGHYRRHDFLVPVGQYALRVKDAKSGRARRRDVLVRAGQVVYVKP